MLAIIMILFLFLPTCLNAGMNVEKPRVGGMLIENSMEYPNGNSGSSISIYMYNGNKQSVYLTAATVTITLYHLTNGVGNILFKIIQDGTGSRVPTIAASSGSVYWPGGTAPTWSTGANAVDIMSCYDDGTNFWCAANLDMK